jgi:hypothetical protein
MSVKCFYTGKKLLVVSKRNEDLSVVSDGLLQYGERALADLVLLQRAKLRLIQFRFRNVDVLTSITGYKLCVIHQIRAVANTSW